MRWKGKPLRMVAPTGGEWSYALPYQERLAARFWGVSPDVWEEKPVHVRAEMLAVYRCESMREAVEQREQHAAAERARRRASVGRGF